MFVVVQFITYLCPSCVRIKIQSERKNFLLDSLSCCCLMSMLIFSRTLFRYGVVTNQPIMTIHTVGIMHIHREKTKLIVNRL